MMRFGTSDSSDVVVVLVDPTVADLASSDFAEADLVAAGLFELAVVPDLASDADLSKSLFLAADLEIVTVGTSVDFGLVVSSPAGFRGFRRVG